MKNVVLIIRQATLIKQRVNRFVIATMIFNAIIVTQVNAQPSDHAVKAGSLEITFHKTTSVIFPAAIKHVDRGSRDILAQKAKEVENILQLKAGRTDFPETNLTVITADGNLHHFIVHYTSQPEDLVIDLGKKSAPLKSGLIKSSPVIFASPMAETEMAACSEAIRSAKRTVRFANNKNHKVSLALHGIYIEGNTIFYHLKVKNRSNIDYDIDFLRFYIRDKQQLKRTAFQEVEVKPVYVHGEIKQPVKGQSETDLVYALEKFTIPDAKHLVIEVFEKKGGRHLELLVNNRMIIKAKPVPGKSADRS